MVHMKALRRSGRVLSGLFLLGVILLLLVIAAGCTQQTAIPPVTTPAATTAAEGKKMVTLTDADNGRSEDIAQNTRFAVQLRENPTTGFAWNATVSSGLLIQSTEYQQDKAPAGMVGVGGNRTWIIFAKDPGTQKFSATYRRSWEPVTGNETVFSVTINVVKI